MYKAGFQYA